MTLLDTLRAAFRGLERHWGRAVLNILGVLAGVASVVLLIAVTHSVSGAAKSEIEGLGSNLVVVYPAGASSSGVQVGIGSGSNLTAADVDALGNAGYVPDAVQVVPTAGVRDSIAASARTWQTDVLGSTPGFTAALNYTIKQGRFFDGAEVQSGASVVVLGSTVVNELFANLNPIGQLVRINNHPFTVIGVFSPRGYSGTYNQDDLAVMPINSEWAYILPVTSAHIEQILVQASSPQATERVKAEVTSTLLAQHGIINPSLADFQVQTQQDLLAAAQRVGTVMAWMLGAIAVIALLTGAIAIMSLMLANVGERAYEIGIRRAVGAARGDILVQFMAEALLLTCAGAAAGIAVGFGAATLLASLVTDLPAPVVTWTAIVVAVAAALLVGLAAGIYPAVRAARLEPVVAVRRA